METAIHVFLSVPVAVEVGTSIRDARRPCFDRVGHLLRRARQRFVSKAESGSTKIGNRGMGVKATGPSRSTAHGTSAAPMTCAIRNGSAPEPRGPPESVTAMRSCAVVAIERAMATILFVRQAGADLQRGVERLRTSMVSAPSWLRMSDANAVDRGRVCFGHRDDRQRADPDRRGSACCRFSHVTVVTGDEDSALATASTLSNTARWWSTRSKRS